MEAEFNHLGHATWECKYHVVLPPIATMERTCRFGSFVPERTSDPHPSSRTSPMGASFRPDD